MVDNPIDLELTDIKGVGDSTLKLLNKLGVYDVIDLIDHLPNRYLDFTHKRKISEIKNDDTVAFYAICRKVGTFASKSGKIITNCQFVDETGSINVYWFNNFYIKNKLREGERYTVAGKTGLWGEKVCLVSPVIEEGEGSVNTSGFVPIYPQTDGLNSKKIRKIVGEFLSSNHLPDFIPSNNLLDLKMPELNFAYQNIHFPTEKSYINLSDKRLSFNQHLKINLLNKIESKNTTPSPAIKINQSIHKSLLSRLPFKLTEDQGKTIKNIYKDLTCKNFTHRLIQGETGSGKTITMVFAAVQAIKAGYSCAIMAPTEILASQHFNTFTQYSDETVFVSSTHRLNDIPIRPKIYIGTHSLITSLPNDINPPLLFVAVDEQHKFGVTQRESLTRRSHTPHLINLSATPIPRTAALGILGDIKISNIKSPPSNRKTTKTEIVTPSRFRNSEKWISEQLLKNEKIFVVCPNIESSSNEISTVLQLTKEYRKKYSKYCEISEVHGKMTTDQQKKEIEKFKNSKNGLLISTSIIEVGIDIPEVNIMIVHSAERFGLAQLHQLRGRVGRGGGQGICILVTTTDDQEETERLQLLKKYHLGLVLAKKDLKIRGAGDLIGGKQHGHLNTKLKYFWSKNSYKNAKKYINSLSKTELHTLSKSIFMVK